eukprot:3940550-Rhodomonas_salina.2
MLRLSSIQRHCCRLWRLCCDLAAVPVDFSESYPKKLRLRFTLFEKVSGNSLGLDLSTALFNVSDPLGLVLPAICLSAYYEKPGTDPVHDATTRSLS